jgi:hypothetical protein
MKKSARIVKMLGMAAVMTAICVQSVSAYADTDAVQNLSSSDVESGKTYILISKLDGGLAADVCGGATTNRTRLWLYGENDSEAQKFTLLQNSDGTYQFLNEKCDRSVDVANGSMDNGAAVQIYECNYSDAQKWVLISHEDGSCSIQNAASGKVIDVPDANASQGQCLQMYDYNGTPAQCFYFKETQADEHVYNGDYEILSSMNDGASAVDVSGGSLDDGANVQLWESNGSGAQSFTFTYSGDGYYRIINDRSGKALSLGDGIYTSITNVWQRSYGGWLEDLWAVVSNGDGTFTLVNKSCGVLDASGGLTDNGTNIQAYESNGSPAQKWILKRVGS